MNQNDLIIEMPHLQSLGQRLGSLFVAIACWSLWIYFLIPLVSLSGWLMGVRKFSAEVRWFGGYKSLIDLLEIYGITILGILVVWLLWTLGRSMSCRRPPRVKHPRNPVQLDAVFITPAIDLEMGKSLKTVTVWFDEQGLMTHTETTRPSPETAAPATEARITP